jgi:hypothetical protein
MIILTALTLVWKGLGKFELAVIVGLAYIISEQR